ncbi:metal-dependent hydrolase [Formosa agariphila KMM 3901]|uniref:Metal-dependent hydrolase n=1 Tax=Formosa agariphila (strain DSM 15362 / KCTC 12365 / LMG 23005 / KMM 3901 / M-2Alg 35-1) TaxID=1347342 RepID=T2KJ75_FORAG|nr:MBL fold metallo-hydrolase [Formosa agariphila]CDF78937.1 metal-dependent hydrolase [Formosa agariphila KMM 3901]
MKHKYLFSLFIVAATLISFKPATQFTEPETMLEQEHNTKITPISHATYILQIDDKTIYVDPVGGVDAFKGQNEPDLILITDIHGDHLNLETVEGIVKQHTKIFAPQAVADKFTDNLRQQTIVISNGETKQYAHLKIEAIPMYNLRPEALKFHAKGRGNGYILNNYDERIYISGDTEDIPEMRSLKNIDIAFVCMNLPYTMPVESAASAVLDFKPKEVIPYHYRGTNGLSDVNQFKTLIDAKNKSIKVTLLNWYPEN